MPTTRKTSRPTAWVSRTPTLPPELRGWLDNVIVPALVREYLAEMGEKKTLATGATLGVDSAQRRVSASGRGRGNGR